MVVLYSTDSGATPDAGLSHWRYIGDDGEYSDHARTRMFNSSGVELSKSTINGEPRYNDVLTGTKTLAIPSNLDPNRNYWIGAVINPTSSFSESFRANNVTCIGIRTN